MTLSVETPLGPWVVTVSCGTAVASEPDRGASLPSGARTSIWDHLDGLVLDALLTEYRWPADAFAERWAPVTCWGVEFRLHARAFTSPVSVSVVLEGVAIEGAPNSGQYLDAMDFMTEDWVLAMGGPDNELLAEYAAAGLGPAAWRQAEPADYGPHGLIWNLPALSVGEDARMWTSVAWCHTGHPRSDDTPWFAVDVGPQYLRAAARVRLVSFPAKRKRRLPAEN